MPRIQTTLVIDASPDAIWSVLSDWPAYGQWCALIPVIRLERAYADFNRALARRVEAQAKA